MSSLFYAFIHDLFNDAASSSDYIVSDGRIIGEHCVWRNVEGSCLIPVWVNVSKFIWGD